MDERAARPDPEAPITFPDVPQLALDQLLVQLIARAHDVASAQGRLRGLLRAHRAIVGALDLPVVLRRVVEAARELVGAQYAALGVLGADGGLDQFIHVGMDEAVVEGIGHLPEGRGVLGALIADPRAIRLRVLADDPLSVGFPDGHPPMTSFLGVPITIRGEVFGNLYLTESTRGEFSSEDEELLLALAASAAVAIDNARLYSLALRREAGLEASTEIMRQLLDNDPDASLDPLNAIASMALRLLAADQVTVVLPLDDDRLMVEVAVGAGAGALEARTYDRAGTLTADALRTGQPAMIADLGRRMTGTESTATGIRIGPAMAVPLIGPGEPRGALVISRRTGRESFSNIDLEVATTFAGHAAIALELSDARGDQQRVVLLEDRDRIARDLHDHVIQQLFAVGLSVQSVAGALPDGAARERLERVVGDVDDTIRQIRSTIFALRGPTVPGGNARSRLATIVSDLRDILGFDPKVRIAGSIDAILGEGELVDEVVAVLRESLTNIARHAEATTATVLVNVDASGVIVDVEDNGVGMPAAATYSGLANLSSRAARRGGRLDVSAARAGGTRLIWSIPLSSPRG